MLYEYSVKTDKEGFYNVTENVKKTIEQSGVKNGIVVVHCTHTTAGMTINENADPNVVKDMLFA